MSTNTATSVVTFTANSPNIFSIGCNIFGSDVSGNGIVVPAGKSIFVTVRDSEGNPATAQVPAASPVASFLGFRSTAPITVATFVASSADGSTQTSNFFWPTADNCEFGMASLGNE